jgi:membrane-associated protease RseP (regulator of RpoE activity)
MTGRFLFMGEHSLKLEDIAQGLYFSLPFLGILTVHEFGHYLTAKAYRISVSLPYYIPVWLGWIPGLSSLGTMGAFIRLKSIPQSRKQYFDVGIAGPLAGFVVALAVLFYGFTHLPPREEIFKVHPEYQQYGTDYDQYVYSYAYMRAQDSVMQTQIHQQNQALATKEGKPYKIPAFEFQRSYLMPAMGTNLLMLFFRKVVAPDERLVPNLHELMHYPFLLAGFFALFFTALNLIPIGQLDGGHILYSLIGPRNHRIVSPALLVGFMAYAGLGMFKPTDFTANDEVYLNELSKLGLYAFFLYAAFAKMAGSLQNAWLLSLGIIAAQLLTSWVFPQAEGARFLLVFLFVIGRFLGVYHPPALYDQPLDLRRQVLGWFALVVFILCFTPEPLTFVEVSR